eukprot:gb/GECG01007394.1/.p1 GENE.gb/GECG01007394.1/~~gb/GECG01007394.1/.p1  ORF type:complete len:269 (+),score=34.83 gb/GECG01007394.1/:1-807(+)
MGVENRDIKDLIQGSQTTTFRQKHDGVGRLPRVVIDIDNLRFALLNEFVKSQSDEPGGTINYMGLGYQTALHWGIEMMKKISRQCEKICVVEETPPKVDDPGTHHKKLKRTAKRESKLRRAWNGEQHDQHGKVLHRSMVAAVRSVHFLENGSCLRVPSENDSWCAALVACGLFDAVVSEDTDFLIFPRCARIRALDFVGFAMDDTQELIDVPLIQHNEVLRRVGLQEDGDNELISLVVLTGTDRSPSDYVEALTRLEIACSMQLAKEI